MFFFFSFVSFLLVYLLPAIGTSLVSALIVWSSPSSNDLLGCCCGYRSMFFLHTAANFLLVVALMHPWGVVGLTIVLKIQSFMFGFKFWLWINHFIPWETCEPWTVYLKQYHFVFSNYGSPFSFCYQPFAGQNIRKLVKDGFIIRKPTSIHSRSRARRMKEAKRKGRHSGYGRFTV